MWRRDFLRGTGAAALAAGGGACSFLPTDGPYSDDIKKGVPLEPDGLQYGLVKLTPQTVRTLELCEPRGLAGAFRDQRPPAEIKFGIGDSLSVTVFEAAAGGLFIPIEAGVRPGNFVQLPDQSIDQNGNINVPYAGAIKAAGRTAFDVQNSIVDALKNRAIEPQVVVNLTAQRTSLITVLGEVNAPVRYPAAASGALDRILDAITRAGGIRPNGFDTWVMLEREGKRATVPFGNLLQDTSNNIYVRPGDRIYVYSEPQTFLAFGASGQQGQFGFGQWRVNLSEAVAKAGGLVDGQADPASVFLYRPEPLDVAQQLGVDIARFPGPYAPIIFSLNLREPGGFFLATKVLMRNKDILFVSNAAAVEVTKFLQYLRIILATTSDAIAVTNSGLALRNNFNRIK